MKTDYNNKTIRVKVVYYGIGFGGKTTNILKIKDFTPENQKGSYQTANTEGDKTIFFDLMDTSVELSSGWKVKIQLYTVPGQVQYEASRKLILRGTDAVVFVADSERGKLEDNLAARDELIKFLDEHKIDIKRVAYVLQLNKRDLPDTDSVENMVSLLRLDDEPVFEAEAVNGLGVMETYQGVVKLALQRFAHVME